MAKTFLFDGYLKINIAVLDLKTAKTSLLFLKSFEGIFNLHSITEAI